MPRYTQEVDEDLEQQVSEEEEEESEDGREFEGDGNEDQLPLKKGIRGRPRKLPLPKQNEVVEEEEEAVYSKPKPSFAKVKTRYNPFNVQADAGLIDTETNTAYRDNEIAALILNKLDAIEKKVTV